MEFGIDGNWIHVGGLSDFVFVCNYSSLMFDSPEDPKEKILHIEWGPWHWNKQRRRLDGPSPTDFKIKILHYLRNKQSANRREIAKIWDLIKKELHHFKRERMGVSNPYEDHLATSYMGPYVPWDGWHLDEGTFHFNSNGKYGVIAFPRGSNLPRIASEQDCPIQKVILTCPGKQLMLLHDEIKLASGCAFEIPESHRKHWQNISFEVAITYSYWVNQEGTWF